MTSRRTSTAVAAAAPATTTSDTSSPLSEASIIELATRLKALTQALQQQDGDDDTVEQRLVDALTVPLCRLVKIIVPDVQQKCDEITYAADYAPHLDVQRTRHGADLRDSTTGARWEHKNSTVPNRATQCSFSWTVPPARHAEDKRRAMLLRSVAEKCSVDGGGAVLRIVDGLQRERFVYRLSGAFLQEYFARVPLLTSNAHNMGCARCKKCKRFPRLDKIQSANDMFTSLEDPPESIWQYVFYTQPCACKTRTATAQQR